MKTLYLDMDGVIANFEKRYYDLFNQTPGEGRDRKDFSKNWEVFVRGENFSTLEKWPGADELLKEVSDYQKKGIKVEILSSSGGEKFHNEVTAQKIEWLKKHGLDYKPNIVPGRKHKKDWATPDSILIDDTPDVIEAFNKAGGIGILHKDLGETLNQLKNAVEKPLNSSI
jgi:hypothetical protein